MVAAPLFRSRVHDAVQLRITRIDLVHSSLIGQHSEYIVEITEISGERSTVSKRYRNFLELHLSLVQLLGHQSEVLPEPPPKRVFGNLDPDFIEERRCALEAYLQQLLLHPSACTAEPLWLFLDVDDTTIVVMRLLGPLRDEADALQRVEDLKPLFAVSDGDEIVQRLSQDLVIERLIRCTTSEDRALVMRASLTLTQICVRYPKSAASLVRLNAIPAFFSLLEKFPSDSLLAVVTREFIFSLINEHQESLLVYFRMQNGMSQIHRMAKNASLSLFHSFLSLLLWLSIEQQEMQSALADPEGSGLDTVGSLYRSANSSARLLSGLVLSTLILKNKFLMSDVALQAARSLAELPEQLSTLSCRRERLKLRPLPLQSKATSKWTSNLHSINEEFFDDNAIEETIIEPFDFQEFDLSVQKSMEKDFLDFPKLNVEQQTAAASGESRTTNTGSVEEGLSVDLQELVLQELDYVLLYVGLCSSPLVAQRVVHLLLHSIMKPTGTSDGEDSAECRSRVCGFLLWVVNLLVSQSRHCHSRGLWPAKRFTTSNRTKQVELPRSDKSGDEDWKGPETLKGKAECNTLGMPSKVNTDAMCWNFTREFQSAIMTALASPVADSSPVTESSRDHSEKPAASQQQHGVEYHHNLQVNESERFPSSEGAPDLISCFSTFQLRVHLSSKITNHNRYLVRYLFNQCVRVPPWQRFPDVPKCLQTFEFILMHGPSEIARTYAASILLSIPWTGNAWAADKVSNLASRLALQSQVPAKSPHDSFNDDSTAVRVLPLFKDLFSMPLDQATLGDAAFSPTIGDGPQHLHQTVPPVQGVSRSFVPSVEFDVPQRLLHQRMVSVSTLLRFCELSTDAQRRNLKLEESRLQKELLLVNARRTSLPIEESTLSDFSRHFKGYLMAEETLQDTADMSKTFLAQTGTRLESQGLQRNGLTVSTTAIDSELAKLSAATERLFDVHAEVARNAVALRQTRASADALLRVSADMNAELKRAQEPLKAAKREAQRRRDRWIDLEQSIAEAPERRKRITEQLTQRESQEEEAANKIAAIQKVLAEEQASHDDAAAASKESETAIHIIETTIADLEKWESSTRQQEQEGDLVEGSEVAIICSRLSGYIKEREAFKDLLKNSDVSRIQEFLRSEADEFRRHLFNVTSSEYSVRLQQLGEKLKRLEAERKKRAVEAKRLRAELHTHNDQQSLIEKSAALQADVRVSDAETQRLTTEVEALEQKVRSSEVELEAKKTDVRACEQEFFRTQELLLRLISDSNLVRRSLFHKVLDVEESLRLFLSDVTSAVEDSGYVVLNRGLLQHTLVKESYTRDEFRKAAKELIKVLENVDATLAQIDSQIASDSLDHPS